MIAGGATSRRGFVLPLALFLAVVMALLTALLIESALHELRMARGEVAAARAQAAAGSALADFLASRPDSGLLARPRGDHWTALAVAGGDSTRLSLQWLGGGLVRVTATARSWHGAVRGDASNVALARISPDPEGPPGGLRYRRLPGSWWGQLP